MIRIPLDRHVLAVNELLLSITVRHDLLDASRSIRLAYHKKNKVCYRP